MSYAFNSAKSRLDKRTRGGVFPTPISVAVAADASEVLQESFLELGLPTHESDGTTSYSLEVDGADAGRVRGRGNVWYFIALDGARSDETYRSRKLSANALALHLFTA